ncbi:treacle protein isoform X2 [Pelobates fuscus]|uniref:treacle protein isoform X2 n=1 Tax=Pelobates fuscus TaxID=191477 RepID=UPI002FE4E46D
MKSEVSLLALIHQHLLQSGFSKAARELQAQSGEKLLSSRVSLQDIYHDWASRPENAKKRKAIKANEVPSKKLRVSDPKSSSEPSEEEDNTVRGSQKKMKIPPNVTQAKDKKSAVKLTAKVKTQSATAKNMNSVKQPASEQKIPPTAKPGKKTLTDPVTESSDTSDGEEETKMVSTVPAILKPVLKASDSSESSSSDEAEMEIDQKPLIVPSSAAKSVPDATAGKKAPSTGASNGTVASQEKAAGKPDATDSSDSEATDTETPNLSVGVFPDHIKMEISSPAASQIRTSEMASQTTISMSASRGAVLQKVSESRVSAPKLTEIPKPAVPMPSKSKDDSSSESSESGNEEEPKTLPTAKPSTVKTSVSSKGGKKVAAPVKAPTPIQKPVEESSEDSEEEPEAKKTLPTAKPSTVKTSVSSKGGKKVVAPVKAPTPIQKPVEESSEDSEEEPEAKTLPTAKPSTVKTSVSSKGGKKVVAPVKAPTPIQKPVEESSEDSEEEPEAKKVLTTLQATKVKKVASSKGATRPVLSEDSSDESDSDSEEEPDTKKVVAPVQVTKTKTSASFQVTKQPVTPTPAKAPLPVQQPADDSSEESDSESEEEPEAKKIVVTPQATDAKNRVSAKGGKQSVPPTPTKVLLPSQQLAKDSSEDSDSDEEPEAKKVVIPSQATKAKAIASSKVIKQPVTPIPTKAPLPMQQAASDSSEESDSDSDEEQVAKKVVAPPQATTEKAIGPSKTSKQPATPAPVKATLSTQQLADDSSEDSDSDNEEELEAKKAEAPPQLTIVSKSTSKQPVTSTLADSSEESDSDSEEEPEAKKAEAPPQLTIVSKSTSKQPVTSTLADSSEESDSDSEEEPEAKKVVAPLPATKAKDGTSKVAKQPVATTPAKINFPMQQHAGDSSEESDSDSDSETETKTVNATLKSSTPALKPALQPPKATKGKTGSPAKAATCVRPADESSSDSDSSDSKEEKAGSQKVLPTPAVVKSTLRPLLSSPPLLSSTPSEIKLMKSKSVHSTNAPSILKPSMGNTSSGSSDTESDDDLTQITTPVPVAVKKIKEKMPLKSTEPATTIPEVVKSNVASAVRKPLATKGVSSESSDTSDIEDKPAVKKAISSAPGNIPSSHISADQNRPSQPSTLAVQSSSEDESDSELDNSQALLKTPLPTQASSQKVKTDKKNKQTSAPNKEKKKNKSKPKGKPTATPAQLSMLESEEETVQALLEGRSPKKNKVKNDGSKKKVSTSKVGTAPVLPEQDHNKHGLTPALPQPLLPVTVTPLLQSEKKSSKKRKLPTEDGLAKKKAKLDKKAKKEKKRGKKSKMVEGEAGVLEPKAKSSKKDKKKSDKSKKKKKESKDKKKKSGEKTDPKAAQTEGTHISSTDKTSKPKKKPLLQRRSLLFSLSWHPTKRPKRKRGRKKKESHGTVFRAAKLNRA